MPSSRRSNRWLILATLLLILIGLAAWTYLMTTREALQHAENFFFRRMAATQLTEPGQYRFFFATNRETPKDDEADRPPSFGNQLKSGLTLGIFDADIQPSLGLGMLINPTEWLQNEEIDLLSIRKAQQPYFVEELRQAVERSPHKAVLVVLHGFREGHESALRKTAFLGHVLDVDAPLLLFDWPGDQGSGLRAYRRAHRTATDSAPGLAATLQLLAEEVKPEQIWLLANSMGAQVVVKAFDLLYREHPEQIGKQPISHVVLTAPDVDSAQFNEQFKRQLATLTQQLTVYVSSNDRALLASRVINRGARRGESTLNPDMLEEANRLSALTNAGDDLITLVDVTPVNRTRNFHNFSLETPEFFDDLYLRLTNPAAPNSRPIYRIQTADGAIYSVLTRSR